MAKCPTCSEIFEGVELAAITLICLHSVCAKCLKVAVDVLLSKRQDLIKEKGSHQLIEKVQLVGKSERILLGDFLCPLCHSRTPMRQDSRRLANNNDASVFFAGNVVVYASTSTAAVKARKGVRFAHRVSTKRKSEILQSAHEELLARRDMIKAAIDETEGMKEEAMTLFQQFPVHTFRTSKLKIMNKLVHRLCVLRQCFTDIDFLCSSFVNIMGKTESSDFSDKVATIAERLNGIGDVLNRLEPLPNTDEVIKIKCCLELSVTPYERVLCRIPAVFLDEDNEPISLSSTANLRARMMVESQHSSPSVTILQDDSETWTTFTFVPQAPGRARMKVELGSTRISTFPTTFMVHPLSLEDKTEQLFAL